MECDNPQLPSLLKRVVQQAFMRPFYPKHWNFEHTDQVIDLINTNQFSELPVITKQDLREHWDDLMDYGDFVDIVSSSGTTGRPIHIPIHKQQQTDMVDCIARVFKTLDVAPKSKILNLLSLNDMFTLGPLVWLAAKEINAGCIRVSPRQVQRVLDVLNYHKPEVVVGNPAFLVSIAEAAGSNWLPHERLPKKAYFAAAGIQDKDLHLIPSVEETLKYWGMTTFVNSYGCSEFGAIGHDCIYHKGFHINTDFCYLELIDPVSKKPVNPGEMGEVVVTGLTLPRGFIPVRYATGDLSTWLTHEPCACGRAGPRIGPIIGRMDLQFKLFGQTIYPDHVLNVVNRLECVSRAVITIQRNTVHNDIVELLVAPETGFEAHTIKSLIDSELLNHFSIPPKVTLSSHEHIANLELLTKDSRNMVKTPSVFVL